MRGETQIKRAIIREHNTVKIGPRLRKSILRPSVCAVCASFGIFGGLAALFIGIVCVAIHAVVPGDLTFDSVGTMLLIAAIPMILIGSIFLDEIHQNL